MKGIWKKSMAIGASLILGLSLVGCGGSGSSGNSNQKVTLTFTYWGGTDTRDNTYKPRVKAFEKKYPNIQVKFIDASTNYDQKLQTMMVGGKAPDVAELAEATPQYASKNQLTDLSSYIKKDKINTTETWGNLTDQYTYKGKIYGLPDRSGPQIMYYNKKLFDKAGLKYPDSSWTRSDYENAIKKLTVKKNGKTVQWGSTPLDWFPNWARDLVADGGQIVDKKGNIKINSPQNLKALTKFNDYYQKGYILDYKALENVKNSSGDTYFQQGKIGILITGFWDVVPFSEQKGLDWNIAPQWAGKEKVSWPFGSALTIPQGAKHKQEAWKFIKYMTDYDAQQILGKTLADCPANQQVLNSDKFLNHKVNGRTIDLKAIPEAFKQIKIDGIFQSPNYTQYTTIGSTQVKEMLLGRLTPKQTLQKIEKQMEKYKKTGTQ